MRGRRSKDLLLLYEGWGLYPLQKMKTNTKKYGMLALLGVLIVGIVLISGCVQESGEESATEQPAEEPAGEPSVGPSDWCPIRNCQPS